MGGERGGPGNPEGVPQVTFRARLTLAYLVLLTTALSGFGLWVYAYEIGRASCRERV